MDVEGPIDDIQNQWWLLFQAGVAFYIAFLWFHDGLPGVWEEVLEHQRGLGPILAERNLRPVTSGPLYMSAQTRIPIVACIAGLHTALCIFGSILGGTLQRCFKPRAASLLGLLIGVGSACAIFSVLLRSYGRDELGVRSMAQAMRWPVDVADTKDGAELFAGLACFSMTMWFAVAMALSAGDTLHGVSGSRGVVPSVVARYLPLMTLFYVLTLAVFYFAVVPGWNFLFRFSILLADRGQPVSDVDLVGLAKVAGVTHTLALAAGTTACSIANLLGQRLHAQQGKRWEASVLVVLIAAWLASISLWVRYALSNRVGHVVYFAQTFFGKAAVEAAAGPESSWTSIHTVMLASYGLWFALGIVLEQLWADSATNAPPSGSGAETPTGMVSAPVLIVATCFLALPVSWLLGTFGIFVFLALLWPCPTPGKKERRVAQASPDAWKQVSWADATADCPKTGDQYLIVGMGFVGTQLVRALLNRGETRIRALDVAPNNPFAGDERVTYIRGNVLKTEDLLQACKGVDTVYATFALIRFPDRMDFQAGLSSKINIDGTKNLLEACRKSGVKRMVQTSSSNVFVAPGYCKLDMTEETSPLVPRRDSHNHYTWTKAEAEKLACEADDRSGMRTCAVRPCSGVFGPNDKELIERFMRMGTMVVPSFKTTMDFVYVENVVLGHLKAEARLNDSPDKVGGLAFNVSNEEPLNMYSFLNTCKAYAGSTVALNFYPAPRLLTWIVAYVVEALIWATSGKVVHFLPKDLAVATPAALITATMSYTVKSGPGSRARDLLNYRPAYSLDQAIQKSLHDWRVLNHPKQS